MEYRKTLEGWVGGGRYNFNILPTSYKNSPDGADAVWQNRLAGQTGPDEIPDEGRRNFMQSTHPPCT
jgi:hypothetical protein